MCTYLYAAFTLRDGEGEGLSATEATAVARWRRAILDVAIDEMGHLAAVWNITSALGGSPPFRTRQFSARSGISAGGCRGEACPVQRGGAAAFIFSSGPHGSRSLRAQVRARIHLHAGMARRRLTPMATDYDTVGAFYASLQRESVRRSSPAWARRTRSAAILGCSFHRRKSI